MPSVKAIDPEPKPEKKYESAIGREPVKDQRPIYGSSKQEDSYAPSNRF